MTNRQLFLLHNAQTSAAPLAIEMVKAKGCKMWDVDGKEYIDLIAGISVCNVGHCHPAVVAAIQQQANEYMHVLVYGELVQSPQVQYAKLITDHLPPALNSVYFTSSGSEATEGAMKLAKKITGRTEMVAFHNSYHGSSQGSLSVMGSEYWRNAFRPLLPGIHHANYNSFEALHLITTNTACVIAETIQAEAGVNAPLKEWIKALRKKCTETGTLLILDEIQCGFGRNGTLWAFEQFDIVPDILLLGKALGGGMPMGAFVAGKQLMDAFTDNPVLGHITTFGGHPVCCAAGMAAMNVLLKEQLVEQVHEKEILFRTLLHHPKIISVRSRGLMIAVEFTSFEENKKIIDACISAGVFTDWFLFASHCMRIAPPLTISKEEIEEACGIILNCLEEST
jgi:acetylornithine/N-succinyldiaminopimelate aminotransferase